jgi:predicted naringenin-chalcone synthase
MQWAIRDQGFDMVLSGQVPAAISRLLAEEGEAILGGRAASDIAMWAVHPGGRSVLDEVERSLRLGKGALAASREVLRRFGNMSSATVMFVLKALMETGGDGPGCGMAFGPGLVVESFAFSRAPVGEAA